MKTLKTLTATAVTALLVAGCSQGSLWSRLSGPEKKAEQAEQEAVRPGELLTALGDAAMGRGRPDNAAVYYQRAVDSNPKDADALARLGHARLATRRFAEAEQAFRRALAVNPGLANALYGLGKLKIEVDQPQEAAQHFAQAISKAQGSEGLHRLYNGLGIALDMQSDHAGAQQAYRTGLDQVPADLALRNNLALSLAATGDYEQAIAIMETVARDGRAKSRHRQNLAMIYGMAGRDADAARAIEGDLGQSEVQANLAYYGWLRTAAGKPQSSTE